MNNNHLITPLTTSERAIVEHFASTPAKPGNTALELANAQTAEITIKATITDQFCRDVLCTAVEGGSNYWAGFRTLGTYYNEAIDYDEYATVAVHEWHDPDGDNDDFTEYTIGLIELRAGIARLINGGMLDKDIPGRKPGQDDAHLDYRMQVLRAVINDDAGEVDADLADLILQASALSCIRYG